MMRAVRIHDWGAPPTIEEIGQPTPAVGETLVRVEAAAVAHLDRTVAGGNFGVKPSLPYVGGVEGCGVVVDSKTLTPGTRVMLRGGGLGLIRNGTWAEYVVAPDKHLRSLPDGLSPEVGATFFVPVTTAAVALQTIGRLGEWRLDGVESASDEMVIVGGAAGAVGSMVTQLARRAGATVVGLVADDSQAASLPADVEAIVSGDDDRAASLAKERPGSLLVDTLGGAGLGERAGWIRPGGRAVSIGYVAGEELSLDLPNWLLQDVALMPVNMIRRDREARQLADELAPLLGSGELTLNVEAFALEDAARVLDLVGAGKVRGRAVLVPEAP